MGDGLLMILLVIGASIATPPWSATARLRTAVATLAFSALLANYLWWRVTVTVLPANTISLPDALVWAVFLAELWLWYESLQLALILLKRSDRSAEADAHETRLRALPAHELPHVDIFIATYNEPIDVLEKTIAGALALDWPLSRLHVHVLDDGRRDWLADYCAERGVNHLTRADNAHAKAGNINAAFKRTSSEFVLVLDADFIPQRRMLMRAIGFFQDPKIGIVQMPHHFFNATPLQTNLDMRASLPDEQRFFFDVIQPGRDGWDCAFCCGSNGIIRRSAMEAIGGAMPTDSITEDMLLTMAMLRKGLITRYLGERLAIGLAPETLDAYFVQRARWAQGAVQLLYTSKGPLGPGLTFIQRLFFNPSHWLSQSICQPLAMATPAIYLLTGVPPLVNASLEDILFYQIPTIIAAMLYMQFLAPRDFAPLSSTVESVLQSFRLMPVVFFTLVKPHGHSFKVTPKGSDAGLAREDRFTVLIALGLILAIGSGLMLNTGFSTRIVTTGELLPVVAFWSIFNMVVLLMVMTVAVPRPVHRAEERFEREEACRLMMDGFGLEGRIVNISMSGILVRLETRKTGLAAGDWVGVELNGVGVVPTQVRRRMPNDGGTALGLEFHLPSGPMRDTVIQKIFTNMPLQPPASPAMASGLTMLARVFEKDTKFTPPIVNDEENWTELPPWLADKTGPVTYAPPKAQVV